MCGVVTGVVVVNKEFLEKNPEAVYLFLREYKDSAEYVNKNIDKAAEWWKSMCFLRLWLYMVQFYCNITFIGGSKMKEKVEAYLNILYNQNPNSVGTAR